MNKPNIHLKAIGENAYLIRLCNEQTGELEGVPAIGAPVDDMVLQWPINPHFTGASGIASILKAMPQFKTTNFITERASA